MSDSSNKSGCSGCGCGCLGFLLGVAVVGVLNPIGCLPHHRRIVIPVEPLPVQPIKATPVKMKSVPVLKAPYFIYEEYYYRTR